MKRKCGYIPVSSQKGFTLIELAIVLVIIGIILGAVLKGQDLINNARAKRVMNWEKQWETMQWAYLDRRGRFAGDLGRNGVIGDTASEQTSTTSAAYEIGQANFLNPPTETITVGSFTFYMRMGSTSTRNIIVICKATGCDSGFSTDELFYMESIDTSIDGYTDSTAGNVRAATSLTVSNGVVSAVTEETGTSTWGTSHRALVYWFDRPHP